MKFRLEEIEVPEDEPFKNDALKRQPVVECVRDLIKQLEGPFVLALDSPWGTGKTTVVRMLRASLKKGGITSVYFNAWKEDYVSDPLIPMVALAQVAPGHWRALFGKVGGREIRLIIGFALLNVVVSFCVGAMVGHFTTVTPNASAAGLAELDAVGLAAFFAKTLPQLLGEEIITLLPFLAILHLCTHRLRMGRKAGVIAAWLVSALIFGLLHLPTYDWNVIQCVVIIGSARLVLTLPWIMTKNLWVSTGAHILNDWLLFSMVLLGAHLASPA